MKIYIYKVFLSYAGIGLRYSTDFFYILENDACLGRQPDFQNLDSSRFRKSSWMLLVSSLAPA